MSTSKKKWGIDTNILIYLIDKAHPLHRVAISLIKSANEKDIALVICDQNLLELTNILNKQYHYPSEKVRKIQEEIVSFFDEQVLSPTFATLQKYLDLCQQAKSLRHHFDLYFAATLLENDITTIVTNNPKDFQGIAGLTVIPLKPREL